jgi:hypothetical protein
LFRFASGVPFFNPLWVRFHVVAAALEVATVSRIPISRSGLACHGDRTAVLARNTEYLSLTRSGDFQRIAESGSENTAGRASGGACAFLGRVYLGPFDFLLACRDQGRIRIFDVVTQFSGIGVVPDITHHAMHGRGGAGGQGGVSDDSLRVGVQVMGVGIDNPLVAKVIEAIFDKVFLVAIEQVGAQTVHRDLQYQARILCLGKRSQQDDSEE